MNSREVSKPEAEKMSVHIISPTGVYFLEDVKVLLKLKESSVRREVRLGRLRVSKRSGRYYILGKWLLEWLESGELSRQPKAMSGNRETGLSVP